MKLVINGAYYYDKDDDLIVQPCLTGEFGIVDCTVFKRSEESDEEKIEEDKEEEEETNFVNSPKLLDLIKDIADDGDFVYDLKLKGDLDSIINQILTDKKLLRIVLNSIKMDYEHDIKMEKDSGKDVEYLMPIYNEVSGLLNALS